LSDLLDGWRALKRRIPVAERLGGLVREPAYRVADLLYGHRGLRQALASGDRFLLHPRFIGWNLAAYEPALMSFVAGVLDEGDVFLDVGAHVGFYSLVASVRVGAAGRVVAVEPSPASASLLRRHLDWNNRRNVQALEAAASDTDGSAMFMHRADPTDPGGCANSLAYEIERGVPCIVRLRTLDSVCEELRIQPRLVKMDVEGAELAALRGAEGLLRSCGPDLVVAVHPEPLRAMGGSPELLMAWLRSLGYRGTRLDGSPVAVPGFEEVWFRP
jgi:FkbM family methyltransferase